MYVNQPKEYYLQFSSPNLECRPKAHLIAVPELKTIKDECAD